MAWLEKRGKKYHVAYRDGAGKIKRIPAYTDKLASKQLMAELERALARGEEGLIDPYREHRKRPVEQHIADYVAELRALGRDNLYVYSCEKRLHRLRSECGWKVLADITADRFCHWRAQPITRKVVASLDKRIGPRTLNQYLETLRSFLKWCVKRKRLAANPLVDVEKVDERADVRRARRALSEAELIRLLAQVPAPYQPVYRLILATGLRRQEVQDLRWGDLHLEAPKPFIQLRAQATKSRRADRLPLRSDIAGELKRMRKEAADGQKVFSALPTMDEHREYLRAAKIPWKDSEGRRADFHALRHTFGTLLSLTGAAPRQAMELMRHTELQLTMRTYTDPRLFDLASAVEKLPIPPATTTTTMPTVTTTPFDPDLTANLPEGWQSNPEYQKTVAVWVAEWVATYASQGPSPSATDVHEGNEQEAQVVEEPALAQEKTPSTGDGAPMRHLGLEPKTR